MSSFLYRSGDNRRLFNHTPRMAKAREERIIKQNEVTVSAPRLSKILGIILIVVVIVTTLLILLL